VIIFKLIATSIDLTAAVFAALTMSWKSLITVKSGEVCA